MSGIYSFQIDAYSAVWIDCSINQMLDFYRLKKLFAGFWSDAAPSFSDMVYGQVVRMCYNDILLTFSQYDYDSALRAVEGDCSRLPDCHFRKIQISMMGKALDYMRSNYIDVDSAQSVFRAEDPHMHVTRVDFAFDFVNYDLQKDIFDAFDRFTTDGCGLSSSGRLLVRGRPSGLTFQKKYGSSERTIYIGSPASERVLRIYDKYMERKAANNGLFADTRWGNPSDVYSWTRCELQTRKDLAVKMLYATNYSADALLESISNFYQIYRASDDSYFRFFINFFAPNQVKQHLVFSQKSNFVSKSAAERNDNFIRSNMLSATGTALPVFCWSLDKPSATCKFILMMMKSLKPAGSTVTSIIASDFANVHPMARSPVYLMFLFLLMVPLIFPILL